MFYSIWKSHAHPKNNSWILGKWEMKMGNKSIFEEWTMQDDSTFVGSSYVQDGNGKQKILETMELRSRSGVSYYVPTVKGQNNNKEVVFKILLSEENKFTAKIRRTISHSAYTMN